MRMTQISRTPAATKVSHVMEGVMANDMMVTPDECESDSGGYSQQVAAISVVILRMLLFSTPRHHRHRGNAVRRRTFDQLATDGEIDEGSVLLVP